MELTLNRFFQKGSSQLTVCNKTADPVGSFMRTDMICIKDQENSDQRLINFFSHYLNPVKAIRVRLAHILYVNKPININKQLQVC